MGKMRPFQIALSFIRVPRLFISLLLFPLLIGIFAAYCQLIMTGLFIKAVSTDKGHFENYYKEARESNLIKNLLIGDEDISKLKICIWQLKRSKSGAMEEWPPGNECLPASFDVAIRTENPGSFDYSRYRKVLEGVVPTLHICRVCTTDITITIDKEGKASTEVRNFLSLGIFALADTYNDDLYEKRRALVAQLDDMESLWGTTYVKLKSFRNPVNFTKYRTSLAIVFNTAFLVIVALFLALKAHRKVLDYFSKNGALLPMVAACGKRQFYSALWVITSARVSFFLIAVVPVTYFAYQELLAEKETEILFGSDTYAMILWLIVLSLSLAAVTVIASMADLKHRHGMLSFMYKYIPMGLSFLGAAVWAGILILDSDLINLIRNCLTALPVIGLAPLIVAPVLQPSLWIVALHGVLAAALLYRCLKANAHWFAAHLEEL